MKQMILDGYIIEKKNVVCNLNFLWNTFNNGIIPASIGVTSSNEALWKYMYLPNSLMKVVMEWLSELRAAEW